MSEFVLTLACTDQVGIVHAVSGFLAERGGNIIDSQQFLAPDTGRFFMRVHLTADVVPAALRSEFSALGDAFAMDWQIHEVEVRPRMLIMVSRFGHCLNDLLYRWQTGALPVEIVGVVSNHTDFAHLAAGYGVDFHHVPATAATRADAEHRLLEFVEQNRVDFVVLARYMQVLSDELCRALSGRVINIHHSFLPSFKGARPYQQAYDRGVKLIGATAHYVTADLDEGPIIEQEVARVDHACAPDRLVKVGRDVESLALARAVEAHAEHRVLLNGTRTVVFR